MQFVMPCGIPIAFPFVVRHRVPWHLLPGVGVSLRGCPGVGQIDVGPSRAHGDASQPSGGVGNGCV